MTADQPVEAVARDAESIGYVRALSKAADWARAFDQDLPGFDRPTCVNLANGLTEMARHAGERLGVAVDFNEPPAPMFHDCCVHDGHGDRAVPDQDVVDLLASIDNALRNGSNMNNANLAFDLLCERLGVDRDQLLFTPARIGEIAAEVAR
jgi:hypothetical protein